MSFDIPQNTGRRIAVIGGGISGLAAAYQLQGQHNVTLYEAAPRLGGHARTKLAGLRGDQPVDTGFIVFNYANYPHLTRMFHDLEVPVERSDMSFGASIDDGRLEYGLRTLGALVAQKSNLARPGFLRMVRDINRFNTQAERVADSDDLTVGELIRRLDLGAWFQAYYLLPICGAIWSTPPDKIKDFPARSLVRFFRNHALLSATGQHQWWTVSGGSIQYVRRLQANLESRGTALRPDTPVQSVSRTPSGVTIRAKGAEPAHFDEVIFACHSDTALRLLENPSGAELRALSALKFQDNQMILHRDTSVMPKRRACWSSWVYQAQTGQHQPAIGVTYWMNRLQNIPENDQLFVTLNPNRPIDEAQIYDQHTFRHPVFDRAALDAQVQIAQIQGQNNTWYAGAYLRHGFHEDGFASAHRVAKALKRRSQMLDVA
ncbi:NAD(P)/FAD-dependent oxidoreductase [Thalassovita sp.]|jgi:predicted NAD/FAD-binding protein|uniref:NAD(P)/FAD-dependent oxidoreductase n=1 Tax=Thalassovita sp. TaxID=1979401 RepID=UPI003B5AAE98